MEQHVADMGSVLESKDEQGNGNVDPSQVKKILLTNRHKIHNSIPLLLKSFFFFFFFSISNFPINFIIINIIIYHYFLFKFFF